MMEDSEGMLDGVTDLESLQTLLTGNLDQMIAAVHGLGDGLLEIGTIIGEYRVRLGAGGLGEAAADQAAYELHASFLALLSLGSGKFVALNGGGSPQ